MPHQAEPEDILQIIAQAANAARDASLKADAKAKLEQNRLFGDAKRAERFQSCIHWVTVIGVCSTGITVIAIFIIRAVHLVLPVDHQWMTADQIHAIDTFLFSGFVGSVLTQGVKRLQGTQDKRNSDHSNKN
jgi:hypothetical protein